MLPLKRIEANIMKNNQTAKHNCKYCCEELKEGQGYVLTVEVVRISYYGG